MATFGYIRKNSDLIVTQIRKLMDSNCNDIFIEEESFEHDVELERLLLHLENGDTLIVDSVSPFGKADRELNQLYGVLLNKGIRLISHNDLLDSECNYSFYEMFQLDLKINKECNLRITKERIAVERENGCQFGRPPVNKLLIEKIKSLYENDKLSMRDVAFKCK